jgi:hypothetical protein
LFARKQIATFAIGSKPCQEKNQRAAREQQKLSETNSNQQKLTETIRQLDFVRPTSREKSTPYTPHRKSTAREFPGQCAQSQCGKENASPLVLRDER